MKRKLKSNSGFSDPFPLVIIVVIVAVIAILVLACGCNKDKKIYYLGQGHFLVPSKMIDKFQNETMAGKTPISTHHQYDVGDVRRGDIDKEKVPARFIESIENEGKCNEKHHYSNKLDALLSSNVTHILFVYSTEDVEGIETIRLVDNGEIEFVD